MQTIGGMYRYVAARHQSKNLDFHHFGDSFGSSARFGVRVGRIATARLGSGDFASA